MYTKDRSEPSTVTSQPWYRKEETRRMTEGLLPRYQWLTPGGSPEKRRGYKGAVMPK